MANDTKKIEDTKSKVLNLQDLEAVEGGLADAAELADWSTMSRNCGSVEANEWSTASEGCK